MRRVLAIGIATLLMATSAAAAETSSVSVPIAPAPIPIQPAPNAAPRDLSPPMPEARALSHINPTAGPAARPKAAIVPQRRRLHGATGNASPMVPPKPAVAAVRRLHRPIGTAGSEQQRETRALNCLAAAGYGAFSDLRRVGQRYEATIDDPAGRYTVMIDPDTGQITPASAAADRETQALNLLAAHGYLHIGAIWPAGANFIATAKRNGRMVDLEVDPARGRVIRRD
jgi:hypothetical protein